MADTKMRQAGEELLTETEIAALRDRFAEESRAAATVQALAEASGLDENTVREHLRQIRTERAFRGDVAKAPPPDRSGWLLGAAAVVALVVAGAVTFRRLDAETPIRLAIRPAATGTGTSTIRSSQESTSLPTYSDGRGYGTPAGFKVAVVHRERQHVDQPNGVDPFAQPYAKVRDNLVRVIEALARSADREAIRMEGLNFQRPPLKTPFRDEMGNIFDPKPGNFHFAVEGWAGSVSGQVKFPLGAAERAELVKAVEGVLAEAKQAQEAALGPSKAEIVGPPPGFRILFGGRRQDERTGPSLAFAPVDVGQIQRRLEAALDNAVVRDAGPPEGAWTENAQREAKIPAPDRYVGRIEGPGGSIPFDIPSRPTRALRNGIRDLAARAARQVVPVNERAAQVTYVDGTAPN
ncbi:MAG: hypothetical protein ACO1SV_25895 [Fimbriimonas sp.]